MNCLCCNKKLNILMIDLYTCKCTKIYCRNHMLSHNCTFDYKILNSIQLKDKLPIIVAEKISKI